MFPRMHGIVSQLRRGAGPPPPPLPDPLPDFDPADITGLRLWLDAADASTITASGGAVSEWESKDANARTFSQATGAKQPTTGNATQNGHNVVEFDGDFLQSDDASSVWKFIHDGTRYVAFLVAKAASGATMVFLGTCNGASSTHGAMFRRGDVSGSLEEGAFEHHVNQGGPNYAVRNHTAKDSVDGGEWYVFRAFGSPLNGAPGEEGTTADQRSVLRINGRNRAANNAFDDTPSTSNPTETLRIGTNSSDTQPLDGAIGEILLIEGNPGDEVTQSQQARLERKWLGPLATLGVVADIHYSDKDTVGTRHYRDGDDKLGVAVVTFNDREPDAVFMLGDYIDHVSDTSAAALTDLAVIEAVYAQAEADRYYVLGNHDLDALSKAQFISNTGMTNEYYFVDVGSDVRVVVLDSCYRSDDDDDPYDAGNFSVSDTYINPAQRTWLENTALDTTRTVIVFCHHILGGLGNANQRVVNASAVRTILEGAGNVVAVLNGHAHINGFETINGIDYYVLQAATEDAYPDTAFGFVDVYEDKINIRGFVNQASQA